MARTRWRIVLPAVLVLMPRPGLAESGLDGWLRYPFISDPAVRRQYDAIPAGIVAIGNSIVVRTAQDELRRGIESMLHRSMRILDSPGTGDAVVMGSTER